MPCIPIYIKHPAEGRQRGTTRFGDPADPKTHPPRRRTGNQCRMRYWCALSSNFSSATGTQCSSTIYLSLLQRPELPAVSYIGYAKKHQVSHQLFAIQALTAGDSLPYGVSQALNQARPVRYVPALRSCYVIRFLFHGLVPFLSISMSRTYIQPMCSVPPHNIWLQGEQRIAYSPRSAGFDWSASTVFAFCNLSY